MTGSGARSFLDGRVTLHAGDCLAVLPTLDESSIDSCVTDPPYHLGFMGKAWDGGDVAFSPETWAAVLRVLKPGGHLVAFGSDKNYHRLACAIEDAGFEIRHMILYLYGAGFPKSLNVGKKLDAAQERCSCPEDLRGLRHDMGSADPLSGGAQQNVFSSMRGQEAITRPNRTDKEASDCVRTVWRAGERPASVAAEKAASSLLQPIMSREGACTSSEALRGEHEGAKAGSGIWPKEPSMEGRSHVPEAPRELCIGEVRPLPATPNFDGEDGRLRDGTSASDGGVDRSPAYANGVRASRRSCATEQSAQKSGTLAGQPQSQARRAWEDCERCGKPIVPDGLGTSLKPAVEPICLARKPLSESSIAANVLRHGVGAINIDACRVGTGENLNGGAYAENKHKEGSIYGKLDYECGEFSQPIGRWPANVIHDGSEEVVEAFPESEGAGYLTKDAGDFGKNGIYGNATGARTGGFVDSGSAARFFYTAKADSDDRLGSKHPTVKPLDLMQYLVRLVTPPKGTILDPFAGTGTTGEAAWREGFNAVLIEREPEYLADIERRMSLCLAGPDERARASIKARQAGKPQDHGPLFDGAVA